LKKLIFILPIVGILTFANCSGGDETVYKQGKTLYTRLCANCHQENGEGLRGLVPPLAKSDYLSTHRSELSCIIKAGLKGNIVVNGVTYGSQEMPGVKTITEFEVANIMNYINTSWGNTEKLWIVSEVQEGLKNCE
jgi:mono/diheme cytochrome c family protein